MAMYHKLVSSNNSNGVAIKYYECHIKGFTIAKAIEKQQEQLKNYCSWLNQENAKILRETIEGNTKIPENIDINQEIAVSEINEYVPRGGDIENIFLKLKMKEKEQQNA